MIHFIDKDENIIVSMEDNYKTLKTHNRFLKKDMYVIPYISGGFDIYAINNFGLFSYSKARCRINEKGTESSFHEMIVRKLTEMGFNVDAAGYQSYVELVNTKYKWYRYLSLCTLYGSNSINFKFIKEFTIPASFIVEIALDYDQDKIDNFIKKLIQDGNISISNFNK